MANKKLNTVEAKKNRVFIGPIDKSTFLYLLGGNQPSKIIKLSMVSHRMMYAFLKEHSTHTYNGKKSLSKNFREVFCPLLLNNKNGCKITKLHNEVK